MSSRRLSRCPIDCLLPPASDGAFPNMTGVAQIGAAPKRVPKCI